ncbi:hypothetical protein BH23DEI1_BH23DEI1_09820 [soil metagenome]
MPRSFRVYCSAVVMTAFLAGCSVNVGGPQVPPTPDHSFTAQGPVFPPTPSPRGTVFLPANQDVVIRVSSGDVGSDPRRLLVFEIEATPGTRLEVRSATNQLLGASRSPDFWASSVAEAGASTPSAAAAAVAPAVVTRASSGREPGLRRADVDAQAIGVQWTCVGPCVAVRPPSGASRDYFLYVRSSTNQNVGVLAYRFAEQDLNEPNDSLETAMFLAGSTGGAVAIGAIERLFDSDWFEIGTGGWGSGLVEVELTAPAADDLAIYLEFLSDGFRIFPGDEPAVAEVGERFVVRAHRPEACAARAGPASDSRYTVFVDPL